MPSPSSDEAEVDDVHDAEDVFGTPPTRLNNIRGFSTAASRWHSARQRGSSGGLTSAGGLPAPHTPKYRSTAMVPGAQRAGRAAKQSQTERKRSKDRWQRDREQARAYKVLDPMLLDVLGIEESVPGSSSRVAQDTTRASDISRSSTPVLHGAVATHGPVLGAATPLPHPHVGVTNMGMAPSLQSPQGAVPPASVPQQALALGVVPALAGACMTQAKVQQQQQQQQQQQKKKQKQQRQGQQYQKRTSSSSFSPSSSAAAVQAGVGVGALQQAPVQLQLLTCASTPRTGPPQPQPSQQQQRRQLQAHQQAAHAQQQGPPPSQSQPRVAPAQTSASVTLRAPAAAAATAAHPATSPAAGWAVLPPLAPAAVRAAAPLAPPQEVPQRSAAAAPVLAGAAAAVVAVSSHSMVGGGMGTAPSAPTHQWAQQQQQQQQQRWQHVLPPAAGKPPAGVPAAAAAAAAASLPALAPMAATSWAMAVAGSIQQQQQRQRQVLRQVADAPLSRVPWPAPTMLPSAAALDPPPAPPARPHAQPPPQQQEQELGGGGAAGGHPLVIADGSPVMSDEPSRMSSLSASGLSLALTHAQQHARHVPQQQAQQMGARQGSSGDGASATVAAGWLGSRGSSSSSLPPMAATLGVALAGHSTNHIVQDWEAWSARISIALAGHESDAQEELDEAEDEALVALGDAREEAAALKDQLIVLQTPSTGWSSLKERLRWLDECRGRASEIMQALHRHSAHLPDAERSVREVREVYAGELAALADVMSLAVAEELERLPGAARTDEDVQLAMRVSARTVQACADVSREIQQDELEGPCDDPAHLPYATQPTHSSATYAASTAAAAATTSSCSRQPSLLSAPASPAARSSATLSLPPWPSPLVPSMGRCAARVAHATLSACDLLAQDLLRPPSLTPPVGHATGARVSCMQLLWSEAAALVERCLQHWVWLALPLHRHMAEAANEAARLALGMVANTMCERLGCRSYCRRSSELNSLLETAGGSDDGGQWGNGLPSFGSLLDVLVELDEAGVAGSSTTSSLMCSVVNSASSSSGGGGVVPRSVTPPLGGGGTWAASAALAARGHAGGGSGGRPPAPLLRSVASSSGRSTAWGMAGAAGHHARHTAAGSGSFLVSEEELLAHSWVPSLLLELHKHAATAHKWLRDYLEQAALSGSLPLPRGVGGRVLHRLVNQAQHQHQQHNTSSSFAVPLGSVPSGGPPPGHGSMLLSGPLLPPTVSALASDAALLLLGSSSSCLPPLSDAAIDELFSLLDQLQQHVSILMLANLQRTAWLCGSVAAPAMWALEVLKGQAENALRLAQAYDASTLGLEAYWGQTLHELHELEEEDLALALAASGALVMTPASAGPGGPAPPLLLGTPASSHSGGTDAGTWSAGHLPYQPPCHHAASTPDLRSMAAVAAAAALQQDEAEPRLGGAAAAAAMGASPCRAAAWDGVSARLFSHSGENGDASLAAATAPAATAQHHQHHHATSSLSQLPSQVCSLGGSSLPSLAHPYQGSPHMPSGSLHHHQRQTSTESSLERQDLRRQLQARLGDMRCLFELLKSASDRVVEALLNIRRQLHVRRSDNIDRAARHPPHHPLHAAAAALPPPLPVVPASLQPLPSRAGAAGGSAVLALAPRLAPPPPVAVPPAVAGPPITPLGAPAAAQPVPVPAASAPLTASAAAATTHGVGPAAAAGLARAAPCPTLSPFATHAHVAAAAPLPAVAPTSSFAVAAKLAGAGPGQEAATAAAGARLGTHLAGLLLVAAAGPDAGGSQTVACPLATTCTPCCDPHGDMVRPPAEQQLQQEMAAGAVRGGGVQGGVVAASGSGLQGGGGAAAVALGVNGPQSCSSPSWRAVVAAPAPALPLSVATSAGSTTAASSPAQPASPRQPPTSLLASAAAGGGAGSRSAVRGGGTNASTNLSQVLASHSQLLAQQLQRVAGGLGATVTVGSVPHSPAAQSGLPQSLGGSVANAGAPAVSREHQAGGSAGGSGGAAAQVAGVLGMAQGEGCEVAAAAVSSDIGGFITPIDEDQAEEEAARAGGESTWHPARQRRRGGGRGGGGEGGGAAQWGAAASGGAGAARGGKAPLASASGAQPQAEGAPPTAGSAGAAHRSSGGNGTTLPMPGAAAAPLGAAAVAGAPQQQQQPSRQQRNKRGRGRQPLPDGNPLPQQPSATLADPPPGAVAPLVSPRNTSAGPGLPAAALIPAMYLGTCTPARPEGSTANNLASAFAAAQAAPPPPLPDGGSAPAPTQAWPTPPSPAPSPSPASVGVAAGRGGVGGGGSGHTLSKASQSSSQHVCGDGAALVALGTGAPARPAATPRSHTQQPQQPQQQQAVSQNGTTGGLSPVSLGHLPPVAAMGSALGLGLATQGGSSGAARLSPFLNAPPFSIMSRAGSGALHLLLSTPAPATGTAQQQQQQHETSGSSSGGAAAPAAQRTVSGALAGGVAPAAAVWKAAEALSAAAAAATAGGMAHGVSVAGGRGMVTAGLAGLGAYPVAGAMAVTPNPVVVTGVPAGAGVPALSLGGVPLPMTAAAAAVASSNADAMFWRIPFNLLRPYLIRMLGVGSFGSVWHGRYFNGDVAIKVVTIDRRQAHADEQALERFRREVDYQRQLTHHPNIVRFIGACCEYESAASRQLGGQGGHGGTSGGAGPGGAGLDGEGHHGGGGGGGGGLPGGGADGAPLLAIVMEYCALGSLFKMVHKARAVAREMHGPHPNPQRTRASHPNAFAFYSSWETRLQVAYGAAAGVQCMHHFGVVHRDLSSNNLVLERTVANAATGSTRWVAKVCDFNLSQTLPRVPAGVLPRLRSSNSMAYSPLWAAPELITGGEYGTEADVYSFGIILHEILTLELPYASALTEMPFSELHDVPEIVMVAQLRRNVPDGLRPHLPESAASLTGPPLLPDAHEANRLYEGLKRLITRCWSGEPLERPTMAEVANTLRMALETVERALRQRQQLLQQQTLQQARDGGGNTPAGLGAAAQAHAAGAGGQGGRPAPGIASGAV